MRQTGVIAATVATGAAQAGPQGVTMFQRAGRAVRAVRREDGAAPGVAPVSRPGA